MTIKLNAPAKINLGLSIVGRRPDEYHLLQSLFWPVALTDHLEVFSSSTLVVNASWKDATPIPLPQNESNLVWKALDRVTEGAPPPWRVEIQKRIPMGGGLGGGSSDAGAILRHWVSKGGSWNQAKAVAPSIGADVPFFLSPQPTWVSGIGEKLRPLTIAPAVLENIRFLLVLPPIHSDTREIFTAWRKSGHPFAPETAFPEGELDWPKLRAFLQMAQNSLEPVAIQRTPLLGQIIHTLRQTPCLYAGLSGSGSSCVAVYASPRDCEIGAKVLEPFRRSYDCRCLSTETFIEA
jgi:4-diphosphocytidyl-2-C-methyl-D-erythritol kinase